MARNWSLISERLQRDGKLITLEAAARLVPSGRGKGATSANTLRRWILFGRHGVFLDGIRASSGWATTHAAILRFLAECSEHEADSVPVVQESLDRRQRTAQAVLARLRAS